MIQPANYNLPPMIKGTTYDQGFIIEVDGVVKNLTSCTVTIELYQGGTLIETLTVSNHLTVTALTGAISILIADEDTPSFDVGEINYRLNIEEADGKKYRYLEGLLVVRE